MKIKSSEEIIKFCKPFADSLGVEICDVEIKQGKNPVINFIINKPAMDLDTCEKFHNAINEPIDELDPTNGVPYTLNVSSRGIDWAFKTDEDFISHIGQKVEVKLLNSVRGKKSYDGVLMAYNKTNVVIRVDDKDTFTIDMKNIVKMNEYIDFN